MTTVIARRAAECAVHEQRWSLTERDLAEIAVHLDDIKQLAAEASDDVRRGIERSLSKIEPRVARVNARCRPIPAFDDVHLDGQRAAGIRVVGAEVAQVGGA